MLIARLLMAAVLASALFGQSNVGEISGQVSDSTGAAILGCVVTATHTQTGLKRTIGRMGASPGIPRPFTNSIQNM